MASTLPPHQQIVHHCDGYTNAHDLIGIDGPEGFELGPLAVAMRNGSELILDNISEAPAMLPAKVSLLSKGIFLVETSCDLRPAPGFRITMR